MSEPPRLLDEARGGLEAQMLRAARSYRPPQRFRRGTMAALGLAGAFGLSKLGVATAAVSVGLKAWVAVGVVTVIAGGGAAYFVGRTAAPRHGPVRPAPLAPVARVHAPPATIVEHDAQPAGKSAPAMPAPRARAAARPPAARTPVAVARQAPTPSAAVPIASAPAAQFPAPTAAASGSLASIQDELRLLDAARAALRARDSSEARRLLDRHRRSHPSGALALEAAVLGIETAAVAGDHDAARSQARAFLAAHPASVLSERVRTLLATLEGR